MKKRLITSALPYVNNFPHLGNLIQVLSADVFARFCRSRGYETLYVCGTDEYGTATETKALEEGITPKELCDRYYAVHSDIYSWFNISFDRFGRTSTPAQTEITQGIFLDLDKNGYIKEQTTEQLYCSSCKRFLADRYVRGICPHCGYEEARGDQCESCGKLLDPPDLVSPRCGVCGAAPELRKTDHLYIDLPAIRPKLEEWINKAQKKGFWTRNAIQMTQAWIRDGLRERCITRDLSWGIPVPKDRYREKVFYVWFDAPIGYISITANHTYQWEKWWKDPEGVELFQFIGKDNIPFHTVIFPSSLLGSGRNWTTLHHMSSTEYLNYESGKFSKSKGVGVFGTDAKETGIPADVWRFYIYYNRPEKTDAVFSWSDFQSRVNTELIGNLANLVNRTLTFVYRFYGGKVPEFSKDTPENRDFHGEVIKMEEEITASLERAELKEGFKGIFALAAMGNKAFQDGEPWKTRKSDPAKAASLLAELVYLIKDLAILVEPYIPATAEKIKSFLGMDGFTWNQLGEYSGVKEIKKPEILFTPLEDEDVDSYRQRFAGTQEERRNADEEKKKGKENIMNEEQKQSEQETSPEARFEELLDLRVAKITQVERHPEADKLYIETVDLGGGEEREIVSGLVPYYEEEELLGRNIILAYNLKPAKLRGVKSHGMLLAAEEGDTVEVLFVDGVEPGERVTLEGAPISEETASEKEKRKKQITIDEFFSVPLKVEDHAVKVGEARLVIREEPVVTKKVIKGKVG